MKQLLLSLLLICQLTSWNQLTTPQALTDNSAETPDLNPTASIVEDLNGDGLEDFLVVNGECNEHVYINQGNGSFEQVVLNTPQFSDPLFIDLNGDGFKDLVAVISGVTDQVSSFLNTGSGNFQSVPFQVIEASLDDVYYSTLFDINNDNLLDLFFHSTETGEGYLCLNNSGTFGTPQILFSGVTYSFDVVSLDVNNDSNADIVYVDANNSVLNILTGDGSGVFLSDGSIPSDLNFSGKLQVKDLNEDGLDDMLYLQANLGNVVVLENQGNSTFEESIIIDTDYTTLNMQFCDYDNDGFEDIVLGGNGSSTLNLFVNEGMGNYSEQSLEAYPFGSITNFDVADFNLDGEIDFILNDLERDLVFALFGPDLLEQDVNPYTGFFSFSYTGDVDGDGDIDLVASSSYGGGTALFLNDGSNQFNERTVGRHRLRWRFGSRL